MYFSIVKAAILIFFLILFTLPPAFTKSVADTTDVLLLVNGFWGKQKFSPSQCNLQCYWQFDSIQTKSLEKWNYNQQQIKLFFEHTYQYFNTRKLVFVDGGDFTVNTGAKKRQRKGYRYVEKHIAELLGDSISLNNTRVHFLTHSMGAAYAEGMIKYLVNSKIMVGKVIHLAPSEASDIRTTRNRFGPEKRIQIISESDHIVKMVNRWHLYKKDNVVAQMNDTDLFACFYESEITRPQAGDILHALHMRKITYDIIQDLEKLNFCGDEKCIVIEDLSNNIPYRKVCKNGICAEFIPKKGYFIRI